MVKILIIEDEKALLDSMLSYFTGEGNICEQASNYQAAAEKIALYNYDCIL